MSNDFICLFANCIPVKGANRSLICDLQRENFIFVPNSLAELFLDNSSINKVAFEKSLSEDDINTFREYIQLLEANDMIYCCSKRELSYFQKLSTEWDFPSQITNVIIDVNKMSELNLSNIFLEQLNEINCRFIQLRSFDEIPIVLWHKMNELIQKSEIKSAEIIAKDDGISNTHRVINRILIANRKIKSVILHSSTDNKKFDTEDAKNHVSLITIKESINSSIHCGIIHQSYFSTNIQSYTESIHHNTCLNRKISIDVDGNIKNCPSMKESFGNIRDTTLKEALEKPGFKKYWNITKDQIDVCKDCEFRHVCTDCRAYLEDPEDKYSKPLKCGYNPYTCEWEEWSINPLKQKAIDYYGMRDITKRRP